MSRKLPKRPKRLTRIEVGSFRPKMTKNCMFFDRKIPSNDRVLSPKYDILKKNHPVFLVRAGQQTGTIFGLDGFFYFWNREFAFRFYVVFDFAFGDVFRFFRLVLTGVVGLAIASFDDSLDVTVV